ncbi:hypothetical protein TorRG33x02_142070 [Trema orientale]|uniref:Uncharacterized protein n=1 Tax=Trema orientale TaxID=63057 RepID=A0A2P5EWK9_TREOI|nr:hypothetical protein TorRG33x02_142070 [Trema orientale]
MAGPEAKVTFYMVSPGEKLNLGQCLFWLKGTSKVDISNSAISRKEKTIYTMIVKAVQIVSTMKIPCPTCPIPFILNDGMSDQQGFMV